MPVLSRFTRLLSPRDPHPSRQPLRLGLEILDDRTVPDVGFGSAFAIGDGGEWARDIAVDAAGNTYVTGIFNGEVNFDPTNTNPNAILTSITSRQDTFVAKYNTTGACVWAVRLDGATQGVAVSTNGSAVVVTGQFGGEGHFGSVTLTSSGEQDAVVVRLNGETGEVQWARQWGGEYGHDIGYAVAVDSSGNAYSAGRINLTPGSMNNDMDVFVTKFDATGTSLWSRQYGDSLIDEATAIAIDSTGNVLVGGTFRGTVDFNPDPSASYQLSSGGRTSHAGFVTKLTTNGTFVWASHFQASSRSNSSVADVVVGDNDHVYAVGNFGGTVDFDPDKKRTNKITGNGGFAVRLDDLGRLSWARTFGGDDNCPVYSAAVDTSGNLYITGSFRGTVDLDPGSGVFSRTSAGEEDVFVMKLNTSGDFVWGATVGGTNIDRAQGIAVDSTGNVYVTGLFAGPADYDPDLVTSYFLHGKYYSGFVLKLTQS